MIQSHFAPNKSLEQHIEEVMIVANFILSKHSNIFSDKIDSLMKYIVEFHDLGKAIPEFQKYISNPKIYRGKKEDKAHAKISLQLWCAYTQEKDINLETFLLVAMIIWRHHGDLLPFYEFYHLVFDDISFKYPFHEVNIDLNPSIDLDEVDIQDIIEDDFIERYSIVEAAELRLNLQFLFSILIEADRTFLALSEEIIKEKLKVKVKILIPETIVSTFLDSKNQEMNQNITLNNKRTKIREQIIKNSITEKNIESVTLPTGLGKTMIAAEWALKHRSKKYRKVIIVLPFLSIIDQTVKEYKNLFKDFNSDELILEANSIADRKYVDDSVEDSKNKINDSIDFLIDTWDNDFIITTFDQFLYSLLSSKNSNILRFHNLTDSLIVMDEIQALPTTLWQPLSLALNVLTKKMNSKVLIMSATQPNFLVTKELVDNPSEIFSDQNRYELVLRHKNPIKITNFIEECKKRIEDDDWDNRRVLIILNTRASARTILDELENKINTEIYFLSADVVPKERLLCIEKIKENNNCLVIATQCIEAGVDIDMDFVIRDIAPFDSIIQCAGRCNRNGLKPRGKIEIISLQSDKGKTLSSLVYDQTLLEKTKALLSEFDKIEEKEIFELVRNYFSLLKESKDTGLVYAENWAYWKNEFNVKKLLRGDSDDKYNFIVVSQDKELRNDLLKAFEVEDRWERKRKIRSLKGRIAKVTVSVWANKNIYPEEISESLGSFYLLDEEYYIEGKGIDIGSDKSIIIF